MLMLMMIYPQLLVIRAHLAARPFSQRTVTQAWNFRHTQKRRYRGALDALKMAVEAWSLEHAACQRVLTRMAILSPTYRIGRRDHPCCSLLTLVLLGLNMRERSYIGFARASVLVSLNSTLASVHQGYH